jgi:hypothetical protein
MDAKEKVIDLSMKEMYESRFTAEHLVSDVDKDLLFCPICRSIITMPTEIAGCGHLFCNFCITTSMASDNKKCPICKINIGNLQISLTIERLIMAQKVKCCNNDCKKVILISEIQKHLEKDCLYESEKCVYCDDFIIRKDMISHKELCGKRLIKCEFCMKNHEIREDHVNICPDVMIDCKYCDELGCEIKKARKEMGPHENDSKYHLELAIKGKQKKGNLVGSYLDVRDCNPYATHFWEPVFVLEQKENKIKVRYLRWEEKWNEWLDINANKDRIAPFGSKKYELRNEYYNKYIFDRFMESLQTNVINQ